MKIELTDKQISQLRLRLKMSNSVLIKRVKSTKTLLRSTKTLLSKLENDLTINKALLKSLEDMEEKNSRRT